MKMSRFTDSQIMDALKRAEADDWLSPNVLKLFSHNLRLSQAVYWACVSR